MSSIGTVKWNRDDLRQHIAGIEKNRDTLADNRDFLVNLNGDINEAFQGMAGRAFDEVMNIDIENFDSMIEEINRLIDDLTKVKDQCYGQCEEEVRGLVSALSNKV